MKIRPFKESDIAEVDRIWRAHHSNDFSVPDRRTVITEAVVEVDGKVIAYGQVKMFAEAMIIMDKDASQREKVLALKLLLTEAFRGTDTAGLRNLYAFIKDPDFATLLERHFGFEIADNPGELLLREV